MPATLLIVTLLALLIFSFPIFIAILAGTVLSFETMGAAIPGLVLPQRMAEGLNVFALLAVPLFIFAADIIGRGLIGKRLVELMESMVGHLRGGVAIATVLSCAFFGAISGIGAAAIVSIGPIVYPAMRRLGYSQSFSVGLILSAATLSMLIPPGVAMILYSVQTSNSVAQVFLAGLSSGVIYVVFLSAWAYLYARRNNIATQNAATVAERFLRLRRAGWALGLPAVIFGGIYGGVFTPTEAAAVACVYAALVETLVYRQVTLQDLFKITRPSAIMIAALLILISVGSLMTWYLTVENIPDQIAALLGGVSEGAVLAMINVLFLLVGMFVDPNSAVIILAPLIHPTILALGLDGIHLGAVVVFNLAVGMVTPPFGLNIFIAMPTFRISYLEILKGVWPFIILSLVVLLIITYIPVLTTWLPHLLHS
ncbi:TRAP transporter large permease [Pusillimonas noertemannii]|uniref:TRAP transporter large permease protein n=1 Tax=Pusillimonas noertemannii TaxID=305977 RepID=A0A2U1CKN2_9BURK|nr:TRAP transporter large permease [Pusillimonas noertemannii]NYT69078.1 TRAP transporter large permease [Pusillimonas noertemannii]PVY61545.1 C4-dicarboxylate transporter DctM subunit [Pusillimonas noertemannii]TFL09494.1 TRAP transporter large permease [Pusillimonas noertemannii]